MPENSTLPPMEGKPTISHQYLLDAYADGVNKRGAIDRNLLQVYDYLLPSFAANEKGPSSAEITNRTAAVLLQRSAKRIWALATVDNLANFTLSLDDSVPTEKRTELGDILHRAGNQVSKFLGRSNLNVEGPQHVLQMMATGTSLLVGKRVPENRNRFTFFTKDRRNFVVLPVLKNADLKVYSNLLHEPVIWTEKMDASKIKAKYNVGVIADTENTEMTISYCYFATYEELGDKKQKVLTPRYFLYTFSDDLKEGPLEYVELKDPMIVVKSNYFSRENSPYGYGLADEFLAEAIFLDKLDKMTILTAERQAKPVIIAPKGALSQTIETPGAHSELREADPENTPFQPFALRSDNAAPLGQLANEREAKLTQAEGSDLPSQAELSRYMTATEWADRRRTANQILSQRVQIVIQNVFNPLAGQTVAALQAEGKIESYLDDKKEYPINLLDGDDIDIHWNNAQEQLKAGIELDRHIQLDNFVLNKLRTFQVTQEDVQAHVDPQKTLAYGFNMHGIREELWRSPEQIKKEQEAQLQRAQAQATQAPVQTTPPIQQTATPVV